MLVFPGCSLTNLLQPKRSPSMRKNARRAAPRRGKTSSGLQAAYAIAQRTILDPHNRAKSVGFMSLWLRLSGGVPLGSESQQYAVAISAMLLVNIKSCYFNACPNHCHNPSELSDVPISGNFFTVLQ